MTPRTESDSSSKGSFMKKPVIGFVLLSVAFLFLFATLYLFVTLVAQSVIERSEKFNNKVAEVAAERYGLSNVHNVEIRSFRNGTIASVSLQGTNETGEKVECLAKPPADFNFDNVDSLKLICAPVNK